MRTVRMSGLGKTREQRQESLMRLWELGIIKDPDSMAELLEVPIPSFTNVRAQDMKLARAENLEMADGIPVDANSWDNAAIHIREHNEYRKTQEFRALGRKAKTIFAFHVERHEKFQVLEAQKMAMLMAAQQGLVPGEQQPMDGGGPVATGEPVTNEAAPETGTSAPAAA